MTNMRQDIVGLLVNAAKLLKTRDPSTAYMIACLARNLQRLMKKEHTLEEWNDFYCGQDGLPVKPEEIVPIK